MIHAGVLLPCWLLHYQAGNPSRLNWSNLIGAMWEHYSIIDLPPAVKITSPLNTIQKKENNQSSPPSTTCIGYGQGCFKPRGTDIWDKFPRNLAVKVDSKTSKSWVCFGKRRGLLGVCRSMSRGLENGFSWTRTKGGWVASSTFLKGSPFLNLEHKYFRRLFDGAMLEEWDGEKKRSSEVFILKRKKPYPE